MTPNQFVRAIKSYQHRKKLSLNLDDIESEITTFLVANQYLNRPFIVAGLKILYDGQQLSITQLPKTNKKQLQFNWKGGDTDEFQNKASPDRYP